MLWVSIGHPPCRPYVTLKVRKVFPVCHFDQVNKVNARRNLATVRVFYFTLSTE